MFTAISYEREKDTNEYYHFEKWQRVFCWKSAWDSTNTQTVINLNSSTQTTGRLTSFSNFLSSKYVLE